MLTHPKTGSDIHAQIHDYRDSWNQELTDIDEMQSDLLLQTKCYKKDTIGEV